MEIRMKASEDVCVVSLAGKLDSLSASACESTLKQAVAEGNIRFILDLSELSYISSAGLRVLLAIAKQLKARGGKVSLANLQSNVREVFEMTGFISIFAVHESVDAALANR